MIQLLSKSYLTSCLVIIGVSLLCGLGYWQLSRSHDKQTLMDQAHQAAQIEPLTNQALLDQKPGTSLRFMPVALTTHFLNQYTILLDNQTNEGRPGYHVIVPAVLDENTIILVNRGWIPLGRTRDELPTLPPIESEVMVEGYLDFAYRNLLISAAIQEEKITWPLRMQQLDKDLISKLIGKPIYPMVVNVNSPKNAAWLSPERHQGYAFQWFSLAATLLICYLLYLRRKRS